LLFASAEQLNLLKVANEVYSDATFKVVPGIYYQLLTVFAPCGDTAFPVLYMHNSDESDPADNDVADDADTDQATPSHADGVESVAATADTCNSCEVCLLQPLEGVALVPCGHSRFCGSCADSVASLDRGCPICRTPIRMVLRLFA